MRYLTIISLLLAGCASVATTPSTVSCAVQPTAAMLPAPPPPNSPHCHEHCTGVIWIAAPWVFECTSDDCSTWTETKFTSGDGTVAIDPLRKRMSATKGTMDNHPHPQSRKSLAPLLGVTALLVGSTVYDHISTDRALTRLGPDAREINPLMRNRSVAPVISVSINLALIYRAYRNYFDGDPLWWAPSIGTSMIHVGAGLHNNSLGSDR